MMRGRRTGPLSSVSLAADSVRLRDYISANRAPCTNPAMVGEPDGGDPGLDDAEDELVGLLPGGLGHVLPSRSWLWTGS